MKCYTIPPVVDYTVGKYAMINFREEDGLEFEEVELAYPYP